eukprot:gene13422-biopygen11065
MQGVSCTRGASSWSRHANFAKIPEVFPVHPFPVPGGGRRASPPAPFRSVPVPVPVPFPFRSVPFRSVPFRSVPTHPPTPRRVGAPRSTGAGEVPAPAKYRRQRSTGLGVPA